jgi:hypothetical protein
MIKMLGVEPRDDYPRGKATGRTVFFLKGFFIPMHCGLGR